MKKNVAFLVLILMVLFVSQPVFSQTSEEEIKSLKDEIKALKESQGAMQKDIQEIKNLIRQRLAQPQGPPEFKEAVVSIDAGNVRGDNNAKLVFIEFSDYQ